MAKISEKYEAMVVLKTTVQLKKLMNGASVSWLMKLTIRLKAIMYSILLNQNRIFRQNLREY